MSSFIDMHAAADKTVPLGLLLLDDTPATGGGAVAIMVLCCLGAAGVCVLAWLLLRGQVSLPAAEGSQWLRLLGTTAGVACLLSACATPTKSSRAAVDAREAVKSRYVGEVYALVNRKLKYDIAHSPHYVAPGVLKVSFRVNSKAKVENVHIDNTRETSPVLIGITVLAIQNAELPPMPSEVISLLANQKQKSLGLSYQIRIQSSSKGRSTPGTKSTVVEDKTPKSRYIQQVTGQVEKKWHIYRQLRREGVYFGSLRIIFYVNKMGKVEDLKVINDKDSNKVLTEFTLQAIRDAEIPPMPADVIPLLPLNDQERLKVEYYVLIY